MRSVPRLFTVKLLPLLLIVTLTMTGCSKFDAEGFVQAYLNLWMQGEADDAVELNKEKTRSELIEDYETRVFAFDEVYITGDMEMDDQLLSDYFDLTKQIFSVMRYKVKGADKNDDVYEVSVEITTVNIFKEYVSQIQALSEEMMAAAENGEYEGTDDQIDEQLKAEFIYIAYDRLYECYVNMEYGDKQTVIIHVEKNDDGDYEIREDDFSEMLIKMLSIDEITG